MKATFTSILEKFDSNLWGTHLKVPNEVAKPFVQAKIKRIRCSINGSKPNHCALLSLGNKKWYINVNKSFCKINHLELKARLNVHIYEDTSKYGMQMPVELEEVLNQNMVADVHFEALSSGKQRNLIHFVASIKSSEIKIRRALVVANHLTGHSGTIDFPDLYSEIKEANNLYKF